MTSHFDPNTCFTRKLNDDAMSAPRILVLGSYVHANCLLINRLPNPGESLLAHDWLTEHGGKGLNVAVGLHRLGVKTLPVFAIGNDEAGNQMLTWLSDIGLDDSHVFRLGSKSGYGVGLIASDGQNTIAVYPGANNLLGEQQVEFAFSTLTSGDWVYGQFEINDEPILASFRYAKKIGCTTVLNPSPWRVLSRDLIELTDILILNQQEANLWLNVNSDGSNIIHWEHKIKSWLTRHAGSKQMVILTLAELGSLAVTLKKTIYQPAFKINLLDSTGAGDAFVAGLIAGLSRGFTVEYALTEANACGALVASRLGAWQALPHKLELLTWIDEQSAAQ